MHVEDGAEPTYSMSQFYRMRIPLCGKPRSYEFIRKMVMDYNIQPEGKSTRNSPEFKSSSLEKAITQYEQDKVVATTDTDELKRQKLEKEVEKLDKDIQQKDLEIEQLRNTLVDTQQVADFLAERRAIELAILRRVLFVDMPLEVPGTTVPQARERGTIYYNKIVEAYLQAENLWEEKTERAPIENNHLANIISQIESAFEKSAKEHQSNEVKADSQPINS